MLLTVIWVIIQEMLYICLLKKAGVYEHNENIMNRMEVEKVVIPCHDIVVSANILSKKAGLLYLKLK